MALANTQNSLKRYQARINSWRGLNRSDGAGDGSLHECSNLTTDDYPAIKTRAGRSLVSGWTGMNVTDVYNADGRTVVVADGKLYVDGVEKAEVGNGKKQWALVNTKLVIWPDKLELDLNDGSVRALAAENTGTIRIGEDGGELTISAGGAVQRNTMQFVDGLYIPGSGSTYTYEHLSWSDGVFTGTGRQHKSCTNLEVGDLFIPKLSHGRYVPRTDSEEVLTGDHYAIVESVKTLYYDYGLWWANTVTYSVWDEAGSARTIDAQFEDGDPVSFSGFIVKANDMDNVILEDVGGGSAAAAPGTFIASAYYYNVPAGGMSAGIYAVQYNLNAPDATASYYAMGRINVKRTLREGEQIYYTGGALVENTSADKAKDYYIDKDGGSWYVYDPVTKTRELLEQPTSGSGGTITCSLILPGEQNASAKMERKIPDLAYVCEHDNRLWGVSNEETEQIYNERTKSYETVRSRVIFGSSLGMPSRFYEFKNVSTDSYSVAVAGVGDFTAVCSYNGALCAWKEDRLYRLTGSYPAEYYLRSYHYDGVAEGSANSLEVINEVLYYLAPAGVMAYTGTAPTLIGEPLGIKSLVDGVAGRDRTHYYLAAAASATDLRLYVYDAVHGLWCVEAAPWCSGMDRFGDHCLAAIDGKLYKLEDAESTEKVPWSAELFRWDEGTFRHKRYLTVTVEADVASGATIALQYRDERDTTWQDAQLQRQPEIEERIYRFVLDSKRAARLHVRLQGEGKMKLYALEKEWTLEEER